MKIIKKSDLLLIPASLIVCVLVYFIMSRAGSAEPKKAEIYHENKLVFTVDLDAGTSETMVMPDNPNVVIEKSEDGSIRFSSSDCPDKVCVKTGKINLPGSVAVCLPNKTMIKVVSARSDIDIMAG